MASVLARNTLTMLSWQIGRAALQALWAIGVARLLGVEGYGTLAGLAGLATALGALSGLGFGLVMLQGASQDPAALSLYWRRSFWRLLLSAVGLGCLYLPLARIWLHSTLGAGALIAIMLSELLVAPLTTQASYAFQSRERMGWAGAMYALAPCGNVLALLACVAGPTGITLDAYLRWHLAGALFAAVLSLAAVGSLLRPAWRPAAARVSDYRDASGFLAMRIVDTGLGTIDKSLVLRLAGAEVAGQYTAAYRLAALIALPAVSLAISAGPRAFRQAGDVVAQTMFLRRLLRAGLLLGCVSVPIAWGLSWLLPWLFGGDFGHAARLARINAAFPALLGMASLGCTMLMAGGRKRIRIGLQLGALLLLLLGMWLFIPVSAGIGAIAALDLTYLLLVLGLWWALWRPETAGCKGE